MVDIESGRLPGTGGTPRMTGRWLTLEGLRGHFRIADHDEGLRRGWLRLTRSPGLDTLDLSAHPGPLELLLCASAIPESVILPEAGAFVHIQLEGAGMPDLQIRGSVLGCLIEHLREETEPSTLYAFLLDKSKGLILQSTDPVHAQAGIQRHVRIDQSERGLQVKDLRPRVDPDQILWRLIEPARADRCPRTQLLWLARRPGGLDQALAGTSAAATEYRRRLLAALVQPPPVDRPLATDRLPMDNLALLAWLARSGNGLQALWLLRCGLQQLETGHSVDAGSHAVVESAGPCWPDEGFGRFRAKPVPEADLALFALCQHLTITRPYADRLAGLDYPSQVLGIVRQAACSELDPGASRRLCDILVNALGSLRRSAARDRERDPQIHGRQWNLQRRESEALDHLVDALAVLGHVPAIDAFLELADTALDCEHRMQLGIALHRYGWPQGRLLVARCLEGEERMTATARRRAMECLLSPLPDRVGREQSEAPA